ncbi:AsmA family protein [soil metagenome]
MATRPMSRTRRTVFWVLGILLLLITIIVIVLATLDINRFKPTIEEKVSAATGREFHIGGDLGLAWHRGVGEGFWAHIVPTPEITANDITLGNAPGMKTPNMAELKSAAVSIQLLPLLVKTISLPSIKLEAPVINLQRNKDLSNNWTFKKPDGPADDKPSEWTPKIGALQIGDGQLSLLDASTGVDMLAHWSTIDPAAAGGAPQAADAPAYGLQFDLSGKYHDAKISGRGKAGGVLSLQQPDVRYPIQFTAQAGQFKAAVEGIIADPLKLEGVDLRVALDAPSMAAIYELTGLVLPETPPFHTDGRLVGKLTTGVARWSYENFNGNVGKSDLHGTLAFETRQPRPLLTGTLTSNRLALADLGPALGSKETDKQNEEKNKALPPKEAKANQKVLPDAKFSTERWNMMDAKVDFTGKSLIKDDSLALSDMHFNVNLDDRKLTLDPVEFGLAGGRLHSVIVLDARGQALVARIDGTARSIQLKQLFPTVELMQKSAGELNANLALGTKGSSVAEMLGNSDGEIKLLANDGKVSQQLLELAGLNVGKYVISKLYGDKDVTLNCVGFDIGVTDGVAAMRNAKISTDDSIVNITGNVDMKNEKIDLRVKPENTSIRIASLRTPIDVGGTFANPAPSLEVTPLALRAGGAVVAGIVALPLAILPLIVPGKEPPQDCKSLLAQASEKPTAPSTGDKKK